MSEDQMESGFTGQEIAIIGMAGRFPGAGDVEQYWSNICGKLESIYFFTDHELEEAGISPRLLAKPDYVKANGLLADSDLFDAAFFGIHPREAEITDPQYRLFLECAWEALEVAGYDPRTYPGGIGVYAGAGSSSYAINVYSHPEALETMTPLQVSMALDKDFLTTRVSYKLGLRGPSVVVQTACSTSLVSVHLACQALLAGECHMALAGGVAVPASPRAGYLYREGGINSPDGHCRAFDARARGTVAGSGLGIVVLKRLEEAREDGDRIYAAIKGSAVNNDGDLKVGYTAPGIEGQARVIRAALEVAEVAPETVGYVEAHGTGTELGDPVEISALTQAFRTAEGRRGRCAIGSVKTNIGHLDAAAGIAGLIKVVLALDRKLLPPSLHFEQPNPQIDFAAGPFYVNTQPTPWKADGAPRRAGVSSFGIGGTNAHVVLEEAPPLAPSGPASDVQLLVLSARSGPALERATDNLVAHLGNRSEQPLADVAYTLQVGRSAFEHRRIVVCRSREEAMARLAAREPGRVFTRHQRHRGPSLAFLFPGQGTQRPGMARELYAGEPVFARWIDHCAELLSPHLGLDLRALLCSPETGVEESERRLAETDLAQPALFAVEYALARLWMEWVGEPEVMLGHSLGEYVAACLSGVFSLEEALRLVSVRGRLMQGCESGAMLAVELPLEEVKPLLGHALCLAAVNGPRVSVLSGPDTAIAAVDRDLASRGVQRRRLRTSRAFHSSLMDPILDPFAEELRRIRLRPPQKPYVSNLTGVLIRDEEATDVGYWVRHLRHTVRFGDGLGTLWQEPDRILLEIGPGGALSSLARRHPARPERGLAFASLDSRTESEAASASEQELLLTALGRLWLAGVEVRWKHFHAPARRRRVALPTYPFERQRYRLERSPQVGLSGPDLPLASPPDVPRPGGEPRAAAPTGYSRPELDTPYEAPRSDEERAVAACWQRLLGIEQVGAHDDFFGLGGDSLLATLMAERLREQTHLDLPLRDLLATPTVAGVAAAIGEQRRRVGERQEPELLVPTLVPDPARWHEPFPLTDVQQAYWVGRSGALELGNVATHAYEEIDCVGLDLPRLNRALCRLIERQPMLRAIVLPDGRQQVLPLVPPYRIEVLDLAGRLPAEAEEELARLRGRMSHQVLPSDRWPLFEVRASRLDERRTRLHWSFDLLLGDAWSFILIFSDLFRFYGDPELQLPPFAISPRDYVLAELELRQGELYQRCLAYWQDRLATLPPAPELPLSRRLSEMATPRFTRRKLDLEEPAWSRLKARAARVGVTPSGILLAAFGEMLAVWSKSPRFTLNLTLFNRLPLHPQIDELVGDFTSLLLLEVDASGDDPFETRARRLQGRLWEDLDHRLVSGVKVVRELARKRGGAGQVAMPVVFTSVLGLRLPKASTAEETVMEESAGLTSKVVYSISQTPQVLLDFQVSEVKGALSCNWDVVDEAFPAGMIDAMLGAMRRLLARLDDEETWLRPVRGLVPAEQLEARWAVNDTARTMPCLTLDGLFTAQAALRPQAPAVLATDRVLSYADLACRSGRIARRLQQLGARPDRLVAVALPKGWRQVVAVLGVTRSGAAYLPIDPALPAERLLYLLAEGEVEIALCDRSTDAEIDWPPAVHRLWIEEEEPEADPDEPVLAASSRPDDLAYVIFTSGSTGQPKGVMIEHAAAVNTILDINQRFAIGPEDRVLALSSLSFDLSVYDIFGVLAAGGAVVIPEPAAAREPSRWLELIERQQITVWNSVPALLQMLLDHIADRRGLLAPCLRLALLSGDWIPLGLPDRLKALLAGVQVVSLGGATEASIWSILYSIERIDPGWSSIPYGLPMANQTWNVLDHRLEPRPVWVPGELYIGGEGVARGYWRDEEKTRSRFLADPSSGGRLYRTGDLGRYLPDGTIEFLGREDLQVKVQGHRIELGEIESALEQHPAVSQATVVVLGDLRGERRLAACVVATLGSAVEGELLSYLHSTLPAAMVPSDWLFIDALPLTANGKVDRQALTRLAAERRTETREGSWRPLTPAEELLAAICCELLGLPRLGLGDDFFAAGGDSLKATQLASRIREVFGVELEVRQVFLAPTMAELAAVLTQQPGAGAAPCEPPLVPVMRDGDLPLSFGQERLWFYDQMHPASAGYNLPRALRLSGPLQVMPLARAFQDIVRRHEVLRTAFPIGEDNLPRQRISPPSPSDLPVVDLRWLGEAGRQREARRLGQELSRFPFDLALGPLMRTSLLWLDHEEHLLHVCVHHIACDAWSLGVLARELTVLYQAFAEGRPSPLPELSIQYADFASWQRARLSRVLEGELAYWRRQLAGAPEALELPADRPRSPKGEGPGAAHFFVLTQELSAALYDLGRKRQVTLFMVLLAGFDSLLYLLTGERDLVVGTSVAHRTHVEVEPLIGCFVNQLALRVDLGRAPRFTDLLDQVREVTLGAYSHQDLPFEKVVEELRSERRPGVPPIFQVMFELHNVPGSSAQAAAMSFSEVEAPTGASPFDLTLYMQEAGGRLSGSFHYRADRFEAATIVRLQRSFSALLEEVVRDPRQPLENLLTESPETAAAVLGDFNELLA
jgi:amino acid adenylation domain-containing protein